MAVYTEVDDKALSGFLSQYTVGDAISLKGIAEGVENSNYLLQTEQALFILTLYEKRVNPNDLPYFLGLMQHLAGKGLPCPLPVENKKESFLTSIGERPAALITFLQGVSHKDPHPSHIYQVGMALARLHMASSDFNLVRENSLSVLGWHDLFKGMADQIDTHFTGLHEIIQQELHFLEQHWPKLHSLPHGTIHADLFPDNVLFLKDTLSGIIDFYFACTDFFAYDLAICFNAWVFTPEGQLNSEKADALMAGYQSVRPLTEGEKAIFGVLARGAALRFLLTRVHDWIFHDPTAFVTRKDPKEYWEKLRFHQAQSLGRTAG